MPVGRDGMDVDDGAGAAVCRRRCRWRCRWRGGGRFSHLVLCLPHSYPTRIRNECDDGILAPRTGVARAIFAPGSTRRTATSTLRTARDPSVKAQCSARRYDRGDAHHRRGRPPRRPGSRPARGGDHGPWPAVHPGRGRHGQDPRDHAPGRLCPGDRGGPAVGRPGRHLHGQGRHGDARSPGRRRGAEASRRSRSMRRPCANSAISGRASTTATCPGSSRRRRRCSCRWRGRCPAGTDTWPSGTSRPRSSGRRHAGSHPRATPMASSRSGTTARCHRT